MPSLKTSVLLPVRYLSRSLLQARKPPTSARFAAGRTSLLPTHSLGFNRTLSLSTGRSRTAPSHPLIFPSTGFEVIDPSIQIEEETLWFYDPLVFYPVQIGEVFQDRYQVVAKLGWGSYSTIWLCHDLHDGCYRALKVLINTLEHNRELATYQHLNSPALKQTDHGGKEHLRELYDYFSVEGPNGTHDVFVMRALGAAIRDLQQLMPDRVFDHENVPEMLLEILPAIHFLHTEARVTHTGSKETVPHKLFESAHTDMISDIHTGNLLVGVKNEQLLAKMEESELRGNMCPRKDAGDRVIYTSKFLRDSIGDLYLCDFGNAIRDGDNVRPAMPMQYRAPEIILDMEWGHAVDMWSIGMTAWDMMQPVDLFKIYDPEDEFQNDAHHLAAMIALLGPPPREFFDRSEECLKYWDENGKWRDIVPIPANRTFGSLATKPDDKGERELFINFISALLCWLPEDRLDSLQVFSHLWINRAMQKRQQADDGSSQGEGGPPSPSSG